MTTSLEEKMGRKCNFANSPLELHADEANSKLVVVYLFVPCSCFKNCVIYSTLCSMLCTLCSFWAINYPVNRDKTAGSQLRNVPVLHSRVLTKLLCVHNVDFALLTGLLTHNTRPRATMFASKRDAELKYHRIKRFQLVSVAFCINYLLTIPVRHKPVPPAPN